MTARQWIAVLICVAINIVDGFEILIAGYTAPAVSAEYGFGPAATGLFLSASPIGMIVGAMLLSPIADLFGRKRLVTGCMLLCTVGMVMTMLVTVPRTLFLARLITGIGVGAMMVGINTIAAEVTTRKRRDLALVLQATGFPLGGALCGLSATLTDPADWRTIYGVGAAGAAVLLLAVMAWLPGRLMLMEDRRVLKAVRLKALTTSGSVMIAASFFLMMLSFYFLTSWTPKLLSAAGSLHIALSGAALVSLGGVAGDLVFAALVLRWKARRVGPIFAACAFVSALALAGSASHPEAIWLAALLLGFFLYGAMASHYAVVARVYPSSVRASGTGLAVGVGRVGAATGPLLGGFILAHGLSPLAATGLLSLPLLCCIVLLAGASRQGRDEED